MIEKDGISAYHGTVDFQFITTRNVIESVLPLDINDSEALNGDDIYIPIWEKKLEENHYWMLSTKEYLVHHMGNKIPDFIDELPWIEIKELKIIPEQKFSINKKNKIKKNIILESTRLRRIIKKIHLWTYRFLYER